MKKLGRLVSHILRFIKRHFLAIVACIVALGFITLGGLILWAATLKIPDLSSLENRKIQQSVQIYDRTGTVLLYDLNQDAVRTVVPISQISPNIQNAFVASEDPTFYQNPGIDISAIARAVFVDVTSLGALQGGSTITQQVVKQSILTDNKTITRKIEEIILALKLTRTMSKDQILETYLNEVPMGGNLYGVEAASEQFFGVPASADTVPEAAYLAAILPAPTYYSPYDNHVDELNARKNVVLQRMYEHGYIDSATLKADEAAQVAFMPQSSSGIQAPHFVFYVEQYLEQKYGEEALQNGGWKVITTLDANLQNEAQADVAKWAAVNTTKYNATNAGLVAIDPTNGQILAMVGSRDYFDASVDGSFNVTLANRQPGSTFKPFEYAAAFEKGYTPDTVLFDLPTQFSTACSPYDTTNDTPPCYAPVDYDNEWRGPMTLRDAIAQSINVPSVEVLYLAGIPETVQLARAAGISTLSDARQYGLSLALGAAAVNLLDLTSAYGTFAQNGVHYPATPILKITDSTGKVIEDNSHPVGTTVMPANIADEINDVLSDPVARAPLGENEYLHFPGRDVAAKTGTTDDYRDAWTVGYTPNLVVGVWAGNNDDSPMVKKVSGFVVGPMWNEFMNDAFQNLPNVPFERPDVSEAGLKPVMQGIWEGGDPQMIDSTTGEPSTPFTPQQNLAEKITCNVHNILYWVDTNDPMGPSPGANSTDPQYPYWEYPVEQWTAKNGCQPSSTILLPAPTAPLPTAEASTSAANPATTSAL
ncbi:MAG: transglycosylase domain-containing protein [Minisyncoccia bacterium]